MTVFGLTAHTMRIRPRQGGEDSYRILDNFDSAGTDLLVRVYGFLQAALNVDIEVDNRHLLVTSVQPTGRSVYFRAEVGTSGKTGTLRHRDTGDVIPRLPPHVDGEELRGWVVVPKNSRVALAFCETSGRRGLSTPFFDHFVPAFQAAHDLMLDYAAVTSAAAWGKLLQKEAAKSITLKSAELSDDLAKAMGIGKDVANVEVKIKPRRGYSGANLWKSVNDQAKRTGLLEAVGLNTSAIDVNVPIGRGTHSRTIRVTQDKLPAFIFPVGDERDTAPPLKDMRKAVADLVPLVGTAVGCVGLDNRWNRGTWSEKNLKNRMERATGDTAPDDVTDAHDAGSDATA